MRARKARVSDAQAIHRLIGRYAEQGLLLPRTEAEIRGNIDNFLVLQEKGSLMSCVALETYDADLGEIRSLAVTAEARGRGVGSRMIDFALGEARRRGVARVFAVTHAPDFFLRHGFEAVRRDSLAEKIERDCRSCPKNGACELAAVVATVIPDRVAHPILGDPVTLAPHT
jgi:amino-acid N-acetyltransferase